MRLRDWEHRLITWADRQAGQPFLWGVTDCHALALGAYEAMYGRPLLSSPAWSSQREALELIAAGWGAPEALPALGAVPVELGFCRRGDLVVEPPRDSRIHGMLVVLGEGRFLTSHPDARVGCCRSKDIAGGASGWRWP